MFWLIKTKQRFLIVDHEHCDMDDMKYTYFNDKHWRNSKYLDILLANVMIVLSIQNGVNNNLWTNKI